MLNEIDMNYQSFSLRGLTKIAENLTAGSMYLVRLTNRHWYRVTIQKIEQDFVKVFCIDTGVIKIVEKKFIEE